MADAVIAKWEGRDYQARFFWINASGLRDPETAHVVDVSYEPADRKVSTTWSFATVRPVLRRLHLTP